MFRSNLKKVVVVTAVLIGASLLWQGSYIKVKASLAGWLISSSWANRATGQPPAKPWPWADTRVVARLSVPRLGINQFVMWDASSESLAFGPGSMRANQAPGGPGYSMIAGHRDTHFKFLSRLKPGDLIELEHYQGYRSRYHVDNSRVMNIEQEKLYLDLESKGLTLVTCWPFDAVMPGSPERYLVEATAVY